MNLFTKLQAAEAAGSPLRIGMIGAGKFGTMFLAQALRIPGVHLVGVVDLRVETAKSNMRLVGWDETQFAAASLDQAAATGATYVGDDWQALVAHPAVDIIIECTGNPMAAVELSTAE